MIVLKKYRLCYQTPKQWQIEKKFTALSREFAEIEPVVLCYQKSRVTKDSLEENTLLLDDEDPDLRELAEQKSLRQKTKCRFYLHNYKRCCCPGT